MQYSTVSYGSEGKYFVNFHNYLLQYSKFSHGSEGLSSIDSDGSEKLNFIYDIIDSLFTCFFLRDSLKQMWRDLFLWISIGQLVIAVISWLFCLVYLYGRRVISHIFLAFFKYINGKMVLDINWIRNYVKELNGNGFKRF